MGHHLGVLSDHSLTRFPAYDTLCFDGHWHTTADLHDGSRRIAAGLVELGVAPGDRVVVLLANGPEVLTVYPALWRIGAVVTPVVFVLTEPEIRHVLADSEAVAVVTSAAFVDKVAAAAAGVDTLRHTVVVGDSAESVPPGAVRWSSLMEAAAYDDVVDRDEDDLAALLYTGGTTGRSKGVMLSHDNLWHSGRGLFEANYEPGVTRSLVPLPLAHAYGILLTVTGLHYPEPRSTVLMRWFEPGAWLSLASSYRVHTASVVPSMLQVLLTQDLEASDLSALRQIGSGAAPLAPEVIAAVERRIPSARVIEGYGCTETAGVISANPPAAPRPGTVGRPVPGYEVRLLDPAGAPVPVGADGEITVRGRGVMRGYWRAPDVTAHALRDGWLHTGDVGRLDADGYLSVVDRLKDLILRGGFNVYPRDVEDVLLAHPAVAAAAVVGRPDEVYGEEVVAFVALRPGAAATVDELLDFAGERLSGIKRPRELHLVDAVPLTSVGKTDRKALRARLVGSVDTAGRGSGQQ